MVSRDRVHHPVFARLYAHIAPSADVAGAADHRDELLSGLRGRVVEIGAGSGSNFSHYPPEVCEVIAFEPEPYLRRRAAVARATVPVEVVAASASALPIADGAGAHRHWGGCNATAPRPPCDWRSPNSWPTDDCTRCPCRLRKLSTLESEPAGDAKGSATTALSDAARVIDRYWDSCNRRSGPRTTWSEVIYRA